jgi:hypothetical protein
MINIKIYVVGSFCCFPKRKDDENIVDEIEEENKTTPQKEK